nr:hypothetical protein [Tanacetum cinerariifolium]
MSSDSHATITYTLMSCYEDDADDKDKDESSDSEEEEEEHLAPTVPAPALY